METTKVDLLEYLRREDLLQATLMLGKIEDPNFSHEPYLDIVLNLASQVWDKLAVNMNDSVQTAKHIGEVLYDEYKLVGKTDNYKKVIDDERQYYMHHVLERKKGCPLSFAVLYQVLAQQVGLDCDVLSFPSHFFVRVKDVGSEFYVNPFEKGKFFTPLEFQRKFRRVLQRNRLLSTNLYEKVTTYQLVARLAQQLKHTYIIKGEPLLALRAVELLTALFPNSPELTRDRGILYCEMEYFSKAVNDLKFYLRSRPKADDVKEIRKLALMLRGYRETMN